MARKHILLTILVLGLATLVAVPTALFRSRYCRTVVIRDLSMASTQTVQVAFHPSHMRWKISGKVHGTGTVMVSFVFSNNVSGAFSARGSGDYYDTNVSVIFIPQGQASGKMRGSFFLNDFF